MPSPSDTYNKLLGDIFKAKHHLESTDTIGPEYNREYAKFAGEQQDLLKSAGTVPGRPSDGMFDSMLNAILGKPAGPDLEKRYKLRIEEMKPELEELQKRNEELQKENRGKRKLEKWESFNVGLAMPSMKLEMAQADETQAVAPKSTSNALPPRAPGSAVT